MFKKEEDDDLPKPRKRSSRTTEVYEKRPLVVDSSVEPSSSCNLNNNRIFNEKEDEFDFMSKDYFHNKKTQSEKTIPDFKDEFNELSSNFKCEEVVPEIRNGSFSSLTNSKKKSKITINQEKLDTALSNTTIPNQSASADKAEESKNDDHYIFSNRNFNDGLSCSRKRKFDLYSDNEDYSNINSNKNQNIINSKKKTLDEEPEEEIEVEGKGCNRKYKNRKDSQYFMDNDQMLGRNNTEYKPNQLLPKTEEELLEELEDLVKSINNGYKNNNQNVEDCADILCKYFKSTLLNNTSNSFQKNFLLGGNSNMDSSTKITNFLIVNENDSVSQSNSLNKKEYNSLENNENPLLQEPQPVISVGHRSPTSQNISSFQLGSSLFFHQMKYLKNKNIISKRQYRRGKEEDSDASKSNKKTSSFKHNKTKSNKQLSEKYEKNTEKSFNTKNLDESISPKSKKRDENSKNSKNICVNTVFKKNSNLKLKALNDDDDLFNDLTRSLSCNSISEVNFRNVIDTVISFKNTNKKLNNLLNQKKTKEKEKRDSKESNNVNNPLFHKTEKSGCSTKSDSFKSSPTALDTLRSGNNKEEELYSSTFNEIITENLQVSETIKIMLLGNDDPKKRFLKGFKNDENENEAEIEKKNEETETLKTEINLSEKESKSKNNNKKGKGRIKSTLSKEKHPR